MGDLGVRRRPPRGWIAGTVASARHTTTTHPDNDAESSGGGDEWPWSYLLDVVWDVRLPGRPVYQVVEERKAPVWTEPNAMGGSGRRWYSLRLRRSYGLVVGVEMPCCVDPADATALWIDWDAGYEAHERAWQHRAALDKAVNARRGGLDGLLNRFADPFARRLDADQQTTVERQADQQVVQERAAQQAEWQRAVKAAEEMRWAGVDSGERERFQALTGEHLRIDRVGRRVEGRLRSIAPTGAILVGLPVQRFEVDVVDPGPRVVGVELPLHQRYAKRYRPGARIVLKVDPADPDNAAITRD